MRLRRGWGNGIVGLAWLLAAAAGRAWAGPGAAADTGPSAAAGRGPIVAVGRCWMGSRYAVESGAGAGVYEVLENSASATARSLAESARELSETEQGLGFLGLGLMAIPSVSAARGGRFNGWMFSLGAAAVISDAGLAYVRADRLRRAVQAYNQDIAIDVGPMGAGLDFEYRF